MAFQDVLGSSYDYQKTELGIQKRFWFSAFGYVDILAKAGKVWTKALILCDLAKRKLVVFGATGILYEYERDGVHQR